MRNIDFVGLRTPEALDLIAWLAATATVAIAMVLGFKWLLQNYLHRYKRHCNKRQLAPATPSKVTSWVFVDGDSGYEASDIESAGDGEQKEVDPHCDSSIEDDDAGDNNDLHRAIRLCKQTATPRRPSSSPYSEDFAVFTSFLSATEKKARAGRGIPKGEEEA